MRAWLEPMLLSVVMLRDKASTLRCAVVCCAMQPSKPAALRCAVLCRVVAG